MIFYISPWYPNYCFGLESHPSLNEMLPDFMTVKDLYMKPYSLAFTTTFYIRPPILNADPSQNDMSILSLGFDPLDHHCNLSKSSFRVPNKLSISLKTSRISFESCPVTRAIMICFCQNMLHLQWLSRDLTICVQQCETLVSEIPILPPKPEHFRQEPVSRMVGAWQRPIKRKFKLHRRCHH